MTRQGKIFSILRIAFGIVWAIDAAFKWMPAFLNGLPDMIGGSIADQPVLIANVLTLCLKIISIEPHFFAVLIALTESALAIGLILNVFPKTIYTFGFIYSLFVWGIPESFGGPYAAGSTDVGTGIIYAFVFAAFYFERFGGKNAAQNTAIDAAKKIEADKSHRKDMAIKILILVAVILFALLVSPYIIIRNNSAPVADMNMGLGNSSSTSSEMSMSAMQQTFELASSTAPGGIIAPVPTISFTLTKDTLDGWDLHIDTTNFTWTPQNINQAPVADQGHAHLYIDGNLIVLLAPWYHIESALLPPGTHTVTVSLNANDHSVFSYHNKYIEVSQTLVVGQI